MGVNQHTYEYFFFFITHKKKPSAKYFCATQMKDLPSIQHNATKTKMFVHT